MIIQLPDQVGMPESGQVSCEKMESLSLDPICSLSNHNEGTDGEEDAEGDESDRNEITV